MSKMTIDSLQCAETKSIIVRKLEFRNPLLYLQVHYEIVESHTKLIF